MNIPISKTTAAAVLPFFLLDNNIIQGKHNETQNSQASQSGNTSLAKNLQMLFRRLGLGVGGQNAVTRPVLHL